MSATLPAVSKTSHRGREKGAIGNSRVPTPAEIRDARLKAGDTQLKASRRILGSDKAFETYETSSPTENRRMHPGLFKLYLILTNQPVPEWLKVED